MVSLVPFAQQTEMHCMFSQGQMNRQDGLWPGVAKGWGPELLDHAARNARASATNGLDEVIIFLRMDNDR